MEKHVTDSLKEAFKEELIHFADCVRTGARPITTPEEAKRGRRPPPQDLPGDRAARSAAEARRRDAGGDRAARTAGRILDRWFGRVGPSASRGRTTRSPRADAAAEATIRRLLGRRFPDMASWGRKAARWRRTGRPLDRRPARRHHRIYRRAAHLRRSIALERRGRGGRRACSSRLGELFVAERGRGAWLNGRRIRVSRRPRMAAVRRLLGTGRAWSDAPMRERVARSAEARSVAMHGACFSLARRGGAPRRLLGAEAHPWDVGGGRPPRPGGRRPGDRRRGPALAVDKRSIIATNGGSTPGWSTS